MRSSPGVLCAQVLGPKRGCRSNARLLMLALVLLLAPSAQAQESAGAASEVEDSIDDLFSDEGDLDDDDLFAADDEADEDADPIATGGPELDVSPELKPEEPVAGGELGSRPSEGIEEILIQGQQGLGIEIDAASSVTSFGAEDLQAMGIEDVSDVAQYTPNLEIRTAGSTAATFFIRGVGLNDFTANGSGSVAIYQDDIALNLPVFQTGQIFDTADVSIEKGPLGSGPGRNASAGAIRIFSRKPTGEMGGFARVDVGNHGYVDSEGALEVPLFADLLSTRFAFRLTKRDGLLDNRCGGLSQAQIDAAGGRPCDNDVSNTVIRPHLAEKLNNKNTWAARATLRFIPPETDLEWLVNVHGGRIDQDGFSGQHIGTEGERLGSSDPFGYQKFEIGEEERRINAQFPTPPGAAVCRRDPTSAACLERMQILAAREGALGQNLAERPLGHNPFEGEYNTPGHERLDTFGGYLRGDWVLDHATLTSITGAERYDRSRLLDADYSPNRIFEFNIKDDAYQITQDLRAAGELDAYPVSWGVGAFTLIEELDYEQETLAATNIFGIDQKYTQKTWSYGVYGEFTWNFLDDFTLEAGARYNWERKNVNAEIIVARTDACVPRAGTDPSCVNTSTFDAPTGTVSLKYHFNEEVSTYWKYSRGWKGPQFNIRDGTLFTDLIDVADPETIQAFEVGFNGAWFDGRLNMSGALFWYLYEDYQVFQFTNNVNSPPQRIVLNADDARLYGAELEADLEPFEGLLATVRLGWLESRFLNFSDTGSRTVSGSEPFTSVTFLQTIDYTGNRLPNTPRFKASGGLQYTLELDRFGSFIPRYDFAWTDDVFFDSSEGTGSPGLTTNQPFLPQHTIGQKGYILHNFRLTYRAPSGNFEVAGWVRNFTNETYKTLAFDASQAVKLVGNLVGDPRTYGISVTAKF